MKHRFTKAVASAAVAAALVFAAPAMAQAYTPGGTVDVVSDAPFTVSGDTYTFSGFEAGATVTFTLTGENAAAGSLAIAKFAVSSTSTTKTASSSGVAAVTVTLPAEASGSYTLSATGALTPASAGGSGTLPSTGGDSESLLGIWVGGGALVLAGATIAVAATVRRGRQETSA
ncbi:LPXTG cell wall anchor domain-containing protein [Microbacterium hominis]|uniref:LPXTG cell wall anchor domain-containing protein n=1 Tax=Microbacterium TaxID=33882 RepID=UPI000768919B|nr:MULTISPECIES: LPXTG cell wall anchor domain-containing protein [Microbacterium]KXC05326.1 hypothetical protein MhomT_11380 [Microbacterium hominis]QOC26422.1 LPXTG cell wall anchor domain-containing protein [Microbacterium hominis]QOC27601.1 LPXTG cell wall anchor domain-containing protein [Microbacterium hominis]QRY41932.1 LPXTG cell wall anchor domain-containing protein [Microbacterium hominis]QYF97270.1 LPXTG cell wall anchor domain-containing protein [Microbacterium sp. PAMC21962]